MRSSSDSDRISRLAVLNELVPAADASAALLRTIEMKLLAQMSFLNTLSTLLGSGTSPGSRTANSVWGRLYFAPVKPIHRFLMRRLLQSFAKRIEEADSRRANRTRSDES